MSSRLKSYINDIADIITNIKYKYHDDKYRNRYIKYYYVGLIYQYRNIINDYIIKNKHKIIKYDGEFGPELKYVIPFAYWHYRNGTLRKTISTKDTKELYYFSENHEEQFHIRRWRRYSYGIPNSEDHNIIYNYKQWYPVPYKEKYKNDIIKFDKPILVIANKYNVEWDEPPVNYINYELLFWIIDNYSNKYQIIYNRPDSNIIINDNSDIMQFGDHEVLKRDFKNVINMRDLYREMKCHKIKNYNHLQLLLYANTNHFISVHGGASVLASYFGGKNIIFSKKGFEHYFNEFENFYPKLSGAQILHAKTNQDVEKFMNNYY